MLTTCLTSTRTGALVTRNGICPDCLSVVHNFSSHRQLAVGLEKRFVSESKDASNDSRLFMSGMELVATCMSTAQRLDICVALTVSRSWDSLSSTPAV